MTTLRLKIRKNKIIRGIIRYFIGLKELKGMIADRLNYGDTLKEFVVTVTARPS